MHSNSFVKMIFIVGVLQFSASSPLSPSQAAWRKVSNQAFGVGEELSFEMGWKAATAGTAVLRVEELGFRQKRKAYKIVCEATTNRIVDAVFEVRDRFESWMDVEALCSLSFAKRANEGGKSHSEDIFINPLSGEYKYRRSRPEKTAAADIETGTGPRFIQDLISMSYYVRAKGLATGKPVIVQYLDGVRLKEIKLEPMRKEIIKTEAGTFSCLVVEPMFKDGAGYSPHSKSVIHIWLTDDRRHVPVKIAAGLPIGDVTAVLTGYKPGKSS